MFLRVSDSPLKKKNRFQEQALVKKLRMEGVEVEPDGVMLLRKWGSQRSPPKSNIEPENDGLEDDFPLPGVYSQVPC